MKNIKRIAEDIFKAPSTADLISRNTKLLTSEDVVEHFHRWRPTDSRMRKKIQSLVKLFPSGGYLLTANLPSNYFKTQKIIESRTKDWKFFITTSMTSFYLGKTEDNKTVLKTVPTFSLNREYLIEK